MVLGTVSRSFDLPVRKTLASDVRPSKPQLACRNLKSVHHCLPVAVPENDSFASNQRYH